MNIGERENRENDKITSNEEARKKMEEMKFINFFDRSAWVDEKGISPFDYGAYQYPTWRFNSL